MAKYRKRPVIVDAVQLTWESLEEIRGLVGDHILIECSSSLCSESCGEDAPYVELFMSTIDGDMFAKHGDYVTVDSNGGVRPEKPNVFRGIYELIE